MSSLTDSAPRPSTVPVRNCRGCGTAAGELVLDLGPQPAADVFPPATDRSPDPRYPLALWWCSGCGLAQLAEDTTIPDEPRAMEPRAAREQARTAVAELVDAALLSPGSFIEFASPHGGSWGEALTEGGFSPTEDSRGADLVVDVYGLMHEPDQRAAVRARAEALSDDGVLLIQFPTFAETLRRLEWNSLRHGHFAYHSVPAARRLLADAGLEVFAARTYELYSGSVLLLASRPGAGPAHEAAAVEALERAEIAAGVLDPAAMARLGEAVAHDVDRLHGWIRSHPRPWLYGAGSRAVAVLALAELPADAVAGIADGSPAKQGRRMPGTSIGVVAPEELVADDPASILLMLPDLAEELREAWPELAGRWVCYGEH